MARQATAKKHNVKTIAESETAAPAKGRKPVPENETRHDKLMRLAEARVNKACKYISLIGNLAAYKPSEQEIEAIMQALGMACARVNNRLDGVKGEASSFTLRTV